jgi:hypothetical protein
MLHLPFAMECYHNINLLCFFAFYVTYDNFTT